MSELVKTLLAAGVFTVAAVVFIIWLSQQGRR